MNKEQRNETTVERRYLRAFSKMRLPGAYLYKRIFVDINIHIIFICLLYTSDAADDPRTV